MQSKHFSTCTRNLAARVISTGSIKPNNNNPKACHNTSSHVLLTKVSIKSLPSTNHAQFSVAVSLMSPITTSRPVCRHSIWVYISITGFPVKSIQINKYRKCCRVSRRVILLMYFSDCFQNERCITRNFLSVFVCACISG